MNTFKSMSKNAEKRFNKSSFENYVNKINKKYFGNLAKKSSQGTKQLIDQIIKQIAEKLVRQIIEFNDYCKKITLEKESVESIIKIWLYNDSDFCAKTLDFCRQIWDNYCQYLDVKGLQKTEKAELILPPNRIKFLIKEYKRGYQKIGESCYIYITAFIEYIIAKILEKSNDIAEYDVGISTDNVFKVLKNCFCIFLQLL